MLNPKLIRGIPITLYVKTEGNTSDAFNKPTVTETAVTVNNVLVQPLERTTDAQVEDTNLTAKKVSYVLGIPKDDEHDWNDVKVEFFGQTFRSENGPWQGIDDLIPGDWNKKVLVRRYP